MADSFMPSTSGSDEEDDIYLLAKSIFEMRVRFHIHRVACTAAALNCITKVSRRSSNCSNATLQRLHFKLATL